MATVEHSPATQEHADREELMRLVSQGRRVTTRNCGGESQNAVNAARRVTVERHGVRDIAVKLLHEARDED